MFVVAVGGAEVAVGSSESVHATRTSATITAIIASQPVRFRPIRPIVDNSVINSGIKPILRPDPAILKSGLRRLFVLTLVLDHLSGSWCGIWGICDPDGVGRRTIWRMAKQSLFYVPT